MIKIGIPRALLYYQYFPAWKTFFEALGAEVVVSSPTNRTMMTEGSARVVADTCLPVKVFLGHVLSLVEECDYIFIPAVRSVQNRVYNCSKFLGLPDMTKAVIPESPPILEVEIDINRGRAELYKSIYGMGRHLTRNPVKLRKAGLAAWQAYLDYRQNMAAGKLTPLEVLGGASVSPEPEQEVDSGQQSSVQLTIALIGHPYLLYDEYINHRLIRRLSRSGNRAITPEMLTVSELDSAVNRLVGSAYWTYEEEVVGAGGHYLQNGADGVIGIMAFGCGPDSLMMDAVRRQAARSGSIPFMCLTVDEHTAEAGIVTRLEAFIDMMRRRKKAEICV
jgi:predicted nucleotide-binding protein (sugar kinase/HSP70/actin superfamily)